MTFTQLIKKSKCDVCGKPAKAFGENYRLCMKHFKERGTIAPSVAMIIFTAWLCYSIGSWFARANLSLLSVALETLGVK